MFNLENGAIVLTSTGLSAETVMEKTKKFFDGLVRRSVAIVTTAAEGKEKNKYSQLAKQQFKDLDFSKIDFCDLEENRQIDFSAYSVIYVCGGNTFKLLKYARESNFKDSVAGLLERDGIYIGVSAGSIILAPTVRLAATVDPDPNEVGLIDFSGLNLIDFEIFPHYENFHEKELAAYQQAAAYNLTKISNSQAIMVTKNKRQIIG